MEDPDLAIIKLWWTSYCTYSILGTDSWLTWHFLCKTPLDLYITILLCSLCYFDEPAICIPQLTPNTVSSISSVEQQTSDLSFLALIPQTKITQVLATYFTDSVNYWADKTESIPSTTDKHLTTSVSQMVTLIQDFVSINVYPYLPQSVTHSKELIILLWLFDTLPECYTNLHTQHNINKCNTQYI